MVCFGELSVPFLAIPKSNVAGTPAESLSVDKLGKAILLGLDFD